MHCSARLLHRHNLVPPKPLFPTSPYAASPPNASPNLNPILSFRREFASSSSLLLLLIATPDPLRAETINKKYGDSDSGPTESAFLDISIDREPVGRIIIELYVDTVPSGAARFAELVSGAAGASYRRKDFVKIMPNYVQHGGLISYDRKKGSNSALVHEWEKQDDGKSGTKNLAKSVSLIVRDPSKPPPRMKLVARKGKLEINEEETGTDPNGTEFVIAARDSPELDASALVVGKVVQGMDVVHRIAQIKTVQENSTSPYFKVAKLIGDKRAVVAERGFNRPYSKVVVTNCGIIMG